MSNLLSVIFEKQGARLPIKEAAYISCGTAFTQIISNIPQLIRRICAAGEQFV